MTDTQLTIEASVAYQAFQEMHESKQTYFTFLQEIDVKYKDGGEASKDETGELAKLLAEHSKKVAAFNIAMSAVEDFEARAALIKLMS
ncbi:MAG: hypothetical protein HND53_08205 [Proteobacteria bacterium]|nr:hypothetical protein [Pseudomonadota bacterium]NOG60465.1 hypothetical protein [Pseudomonadota bacterium]